AEVISNNINFHILEDYGERPLNFIPKQIKKDIENSNVTYYAAQSKQGELQKFRSPIVNLAVQSGREIHMPNIDTTIMQTGMQADYYKIAGLTYLIMGIAARSKTAKVTTLNGTNLHVTISPNLKWVPDTGLLWYKGIWGNLPAGEVYTCPELIEGVMVVDGTLGDYFNQKYSNLEKTPVTIPIKNSRAQVEEITCKNEDLLNDFKNYLKNDKNANRVGEFACGTNIALKNLISNLLQDGKFPGVHIAFGSPYPNKTGADWNSIGHLDGIMKECSLWFDDKMILDCGKFVENEILSIY
ncbi:MAG: aminopeptidase, partial [Candidatus Thorarchaeota archaeon]